MSHSKNLAIDFAVLILGMSTLDFLPQVEGIAPDMSDFSHLDDEEWSQKYQELLSETVNKIIKSHPMGQHFLEKDYSFDEILDFIIQVRSRELQSSIEMLMNSN